MTFKDVGVEILDLAAADGGDEVAEVALARAAFRVDLDAQPGERLGLVAALAVELAADDRPFLQVGDVADLLPVVGFRLQSADLEDELRVAVVHDADLGVGRLPLVVIAESASEAEHGPGIGRTLAIGPGISQRAMSIWWTPWLPMSPLPKSQNQCQL